MPEVESRLVPSQNVSHEYDEAAVSYAECHFSSVEHLPMDESEEHRVSAIDDDRLLGNGQGSEDRLCLEEDVGHHSHPEQTLRVGQPISELNGPGIRIDHSADIEKLTPTGAEDFETTTREGGQGHERRGGGGDTSQIELGNSGHQQDVVGVDQPKCLGMSLQVLAFDVVGRHDDSADRGDERESEDLTREALLGLCAKILEFFPRLIVRGFDGVGRRPFGLGQAEILFRSFMLLLGAQLLGP